MSSSLISPEQADLFPDLGAPIAEFKVSKFVLILLVVLTVGAVVFGLAWGVAWVLGMIFVAQSAKERALFALVGTIPVVFLYAILLRNKRRLTAQDHLTAHLGHVLGFGMLILHSAAGGWRRARQVWGLRVLVFSKGIARVQADTAEVVRWEEIATVRRAVLRDQDQKTPFDGAIRLSLETADGREYEFDDALSGLKELCKLVEQHTLPHLLEEAIDAYEAGSDVSFGVVSASSRGLSYGGRSLPWTGYVAIETAKGLVNVKALGAIWPLWRIRLLEVPNVHVLIALTEYVRQVGALNRR